MGHQQNQRKLRNYFINKEIQKGVIINSLVYMFLILLVTMAIMLWHSVESMNGTSEIVDSATQAAKIPMSVKLYIVIAVSFILAVINQLWLTHKFCGALVNFTNTFKHIARGDLTRKITLRKNDMLKKEALEFNQMMGALSSAVATLKADNTALLDTLKAVTAPGADPKKVEESGEWVREQAPRITKNLSALTLSDGEASQK